MMKSNQQIQNELFPLSDKSNELFQRLMTEKSYLQDSLETAQRLFSDQEVGRSLISDLTQVVREVQHTFCELEQLKGAIIEFTHVLTN